MLGIYSGLLYGGFSVIELCWLLGGVVVLGMVMVYWRYLKYVKPTQA
jgi:hypothetical protein